MLRGKPLDPAGTIGVGDGQVPLDCPRSSMPSAERPHAFRGGEIRTRHRRIIEIGEFMERLAVCSAVISLLFLISSAFAGDHPGFSIKVFTSPDDQFWVNSVIIEGADEVMLVDGQ
jgi:hypothetical protein